MVHIKKSVLLVSEAATGGVPSKKGVLRNFAKFTRKHLRQSLFFNKVAGPAALFKKETLVQVFACEFCEISKNIFHRAPLGDCFCNLKLLIILKIFSAVFFTNVKQIGYVLR